MLNTLPDFLIIAILVAVGSAIGSWVNWAIYQLAYFQELSPSPWQFDEQAERTWKDRIPILGWLSMQRYLNHYGQYFWIRPLAIEVAFAMGLPLFWFWQVQGGVVGFVSVPPAGTAETWFWGHTILVALLAAATFIDFDERMIPDSITLPGTLIGLLLAAAFPWFRLSISVPTLAAAPAITPIHFAAPETLPVFHLGTAGLVIGLLIWTGWIFAILPRWTPSKGTLAQKISLSIAFVIRPNRRNNPPLGNVQRGPRLVTKLLFLLWIVGVLVIAGLWVTLPKENWTSFFGALVGMFLGGGLIWGIRIVGRLALQQEAMGFGDVTLMFMVGAFLGWQAAFFAFALSPFAAIVFALGNLILNKENELPFGPYLALGSVVSIFLWTPLWGIFSTQVGTLGLQFLVWVLVGGAALMFPLLIIVRNLKDRLIPYDEEQDEQENS